MKKLKFVKIRQEFKEGISDNCVNNYFIYLEVKEPLIQIITIVQNSSTHYEILEGCVQAVKLVEVDIIDKLPFIEKLSYGDYERFSKRVGCYYERT